MECQFAKAPAAAGNQMGADWLLSRAVTKNGWRFVSQRGKTRIRHLSEGVPDAGFFN